MTYKPEGYYVIKAKLTWPQLDPILGKSERGPQMSTSEPDTSEPCGLSRGYPLTYKIYASRVEPMGSRVAHVVLHPDGVCFSGALTVEQDWTFAKELWARTIAHFERYQVVKAYIQPM